MKKPNHAIGEVVLSMSGRLKNEYSEYFDCIEIWRAWLELKRYYTTKLDYRIFDQQTMFACSKREIIDTWLTRGYALEDRFGRLVHSLEHTARH